MNPLRMKAEPALKFWTAAAAKKETRLALFHSVDSSSSNATEKTWASWNGKTMPGD